MSYYWFNEQKQPKYAICDKCNDKYIMYSGRFSQRRPCRHHAWTNDFCRDCLVKKTRFNDNQGCYHTSIPLCCESYCIIC